MPCGSAPSRPFWFGKLTTSSEWSASPMKEGISIKVST
jgi:hypothetical protein